MTPLFLYAERSDSGDEAGRGVGGEVKKRDSRISCPVAYEAGWIISLTAV